MSDNGVGHLTPEDRLRLSPVLKEHATIDVLVPADPSARDLWDALVLCTKGMHYGQRTIIRLKWAVGKILNMFENKPSLYRELGYRTFEDFTKRGVGETLGLSRTSLYECKAHCRDWPSLTMDDYEKLGPTKIKILSKFVNESSPQAPRYLETARQMKTDELLQWATTRHLINKGEATPAVIVIQTSREIADEWYNFRNNSDVQGKVGSEAPGEILRALMQECLGPWLAEGYESAKA